MDLHKRLPRDTNSARKAPSNEGTWAETVREGRKQHHRRSQRQQHLGMFDTKEEAIQAREEEKQVAKYTRKLPA